MELRHLRYFLAVARELHFTRAAQALGIGQPPLSQQIRQLEDELGVALFLRDRRGVSLTEAGLTFRDEAAQVLASAERAMEAARRVGRRKVTVVKIGFTVSASIHPFVPRVIKICRDSYPEVEVQLQQRTTNELIASIAERTVDLAFVRDPAPQPGDVQIDKVLSEPLVAVLPSQHPLAAKASIRLRQLADDPFIFYPIRIGSGIYNAVVEACKGCGFVPQIQIEVPQMTSVVTFVAAGMGVSLVPSTMQQLQAQGVRYVPLAGAKLPVAYLAIAYNRRALTPALSQFIARIRQAAVSAASPADPSPARSSLTRPSPRSASTKRSP